MGGGRAFGGTIQGTVTDSSGAALVGATVTVRNVDTGVDRITEHDHGWWLPDAGVAGGDL